MDFDDKDCNPYDGVDYIIFGNGNGITATSCSSSWAAWSWRIWMDFFLLVFRLENPERENPNKKT